MKGMGGPFHDKWCPSCGTRQLVFFQIDGGDNGLGIVFMYCDSCYQIWATEPIGHPDPRLDLVIFTSIGNDFEATLEFYETLSQFYKLLGEFLDAAHRDRELVILGMHMATILRYETWGMYEELEARIRGLEKILRRPRKDKG